MNVIRLIERLGATADIQQDTDLVAALQELDPEVKAALENRDEKALERLLGADTPLMMILVPADDDDESSEEPADDDSQEKGLRRAG